MRRRICACVRVRLCVRVRVRVCVNVRHVAFSTLGPEDAYLSLEL